MKLRQGWLSFVFLFTPVLAGYGLATLIDDTVNTNQQYKAEQRPPLGLKMYKVLGIRA